MPISIRRSHLTLMFAFPSREDQAERVALGRAQRFAILGIDEKPVRHRLFGENAARQGGGVGSLAEEPGAAQLGADFAQDRAYGNPGPLGTTEETVRLLRGLADRRWGPLATAIAGALEEVSDGDSRETLQNRPS